MPFPCFNGKVMQYPDTGCSELEENTDLDLGKQGRTISVNTDF